MASSNKSLVPGIFLILLGLVFLLPNFTQLTLGDLWPLFVLGPGIYFFILFLQDRKNYGVLMPGTILMVIGLLFSYCTIAGWDAMNTLWPLFIIAPGLGFFLMFSFGKKERGLLIPAWILTGIGGAFLVARNLQEPNVFVALILIAIGVFLLFKGMRRGDSSRSPDQTTSGS